MTNTRSQCLNHLPNITLHLEKKYWLPPPNIVPQSMKKMPVISKGMETSPHKQASIGHQQCPSTPAILTLPGDAQTLHTEGLFPQDCHPGHAF